MAGRGGRGNPQPQCSIWQPCFVDVKDRKTSVKSCFPFLLQLQPKNLDLKNGSLYRIHWKRGTSFFCSVVGFKLQYKTFKTILRYRIHHCSFDVSTHHKNSSFITLCIRASISWRKKLSKATSLEVMFENFILACSIPVKKSKRNQNQFLIKSQQLTICVSF